MNPPPLKKLFDQYASAVAYPRIPFSDNPILAAATAETNAVVVEPIYVGEMKKH